MTGMNRTQAADTRTELDLVTEIEMFSHMDAGSFDEWMDRHAAQRTPVPCPDCDGEGSITYTQVSGGWHHQITPDEWTETCRLCNGTGTAAFDDLTEAQMATLAGQVAS